MTRVTISLTLRATLSVHKTGVVAVETAVRTFSLFQYNSSQQNAISTFCHSHHFSDCIPGLAAVRIPASLLRVLSLVFGTRHAWSVSCRISSQLSLPGTPSSTMTILEHALFLAQHHVRQIPDQSMGMSTSLRRRVQDPQRSINCWFVQFSSAFQTDLKMDVFDIIKY